MVIGLEKTEIEHLPGSIRHDIATSMIGLDCVVNGPASLYYLMTEAVFLPLLS